MLDANILAYAASGATAEAAKRAKALELIDTVSFGVSAQVLQEFYVVVTRKAAKKLSADEAMWWLDRFEPFPCIAIDAALVRSAIAVSERYKISYWDAAVIAAAEQLDAPVLYTEDLSHGQSYGSVRAINPFREAA